MVEVMATKNGQIELFKKPPRNISKRNPKELLKKILNEFADGIETNQNKLPEKITKALLKELSEEESNEGIDG